MEEKHKRIIVIRRIAFSTATLCAALIVCFLAFKSPTDLLNEDNSNIISNNITVTTTADNTVTAPHSCLTTVQSNSKSIITTYTSTTHLYSASTKSIDGFFENTTKASTENLNITKTLTTCTALPSSSVNETNTIPITQTFPAGTTSLTSTTHGNDYIKIDGNYISYLDKIYLITGQTAAEKDIEKNIYDNKITVLDPSREIRETNIRLYALNDISEKYAIASKLDNIQDYSICLCRSGYTPETMQILFQDTALYKYWNIQSLIFENSIINQYDQDQILNLIIELPDNKDVKLYGSPGKEILKIQLSCNVLGGNTGEITLTENGYLTTDLAGTTLYYYIGNDNIDKFSDIIKGG